MTALALWLAVAFAPQDPSYARVESLLAARQFPAALQVAEQLVARRPRDARAQLLLGRVHFARPVIGRYEALAAFRRAARLAPGDPEPLYRQMEVGFALGSDEGDGIAREALLALFAIDPDYKDAWRRFNQLYRNPEIWSRAERALAHHPVDLVALERRAQLALALEQPALADSLLARVMAARGPRAATCLLRAEAAYDAGRDAQGQAWFDSALARADADSTGALWELAWMVASPEEAVRHANTPPGERRAFFERFWTRRDPNLVTPANERLGEHFRRLTYVRRRFRLLHPQNLYFRSAEARALTVMAGRGALADELTLYPDLLPEGSTDRLLVAGEMAPDVGDSAAAGSQMYAAGLDARGLIYIRHGPPDKQLAGYYDPLRPVDAGGNPLDIEGWLYNTPDGPVSIGFRRTTGNLMGVTEGAGDFAFFPINSRQANDTRAALHSDRTTLPAPLEARGWSAFFKSWELGRTDAYFKAAPDTAAVVLWDSGGGEIVRARGPGLLVLTVPPGRYDYGLDVDSAGQVGRLRGAFTVPGFSVVDLGISSLALATADSLVDRETTLARMPAALVFPAGRPLASYAEVYGLTEDGAGHVHYLVRYTFAPARSFVGRLLGGKAPVVFEFEREVDAARVVAEQLVIEPGQLPPGRYTVSVTVTDLRRNVKSESVALEVTIR